MTLMTAAQAVKTYGPGHGLTKDQLPRPGYQTFLNPAKASGLLPMRITVHKRAPGTRGPRLYLCEVVNA